MKKKKQNNKNRGCFGNKKPKFGKPFKTSNGTSIKPIKVGGGLVGFQITDMNDGLKANCVLNKVADGVEPLLSSNKDIVCGFQLGFDGVWEYTVKNKLTNKAVVLKGADDAHAQEAFIYADAFESVGAVKAQPQHNCRVEVRNDKVEELILNAVAADFDFQAMAEAQMKKDPSEVKIMK